MQGQRRSKRVRFARGTKEEENPASGRTEAVKIEPKDEEPRERRGKIQKRTETNPVRVKPEDEEWAAKSQRNSRNRRRKKRKEHKGKKRGVKRKIRQIVPQTVLETTALDLQADSRSDSTLFHSC